MYLSREVWRNEAREIVKENQNEFEKVLENMYRRLSFRGLYDLFDQNNDIE